MRWRPISRLLLCGSCRDFKQQRRLRFQPTEREEEGTRLTRFTGQSQSQTTIVPSSTRSRSPASQERSSTSQGRLLPSFLRRRSMTLFAEDSRPFPDCTGSSAGRRRGVADLRALLDSRDPTRAVPESVLETKVARILRKAKLPGLVAQYKRRRCRTPDRSCRLCVSCGQSRCRSGRIPLALRSRPVAARLGET